MGKTSRLLETRHKVNAPSPRSVLDLVSRKKDDVRARTGKAGSDETKHVKFKLDRESPVRISIPRNKRVARADEVRTAYV